MRTDGRFDQRCNAHEDGIVRGYHPIDARGEPTTPRVRRHGDVGLGCTIDRTAMKL
jgi:hypothetical protein